LEPSDCAMIGDRIYTDMEMAIRAEVNGILVLSGEATREDLLKLSKQPNLVVNSVDDLVRYK
jgi:ribonucleotide monophosphatase NagD (HAD superfamily)